jgi:biotin transport system substrate-specific component
MSDAAVTPRVALVPRVGVLADVGLICVGAGLIAGSAQINIPLPFTPVPVTGQTFTVLLVGAALGGVRGSACGLLYLLIGLAGLGVYAGGAHGLAVVTGASGGYLVSYPITAGLVGFLAERRWDARFSSALGALLTGNVLIYLVGLPWLAVVLHTNLERTFELGLYPFIPGDTLKLYLAAALLPSAWRLVQRHEQQ